MKSKEYIMIIIFLFCLSFAIYYNSLHNEFTFDDHPKIENNKYIRTLEGVYKYCFKPLEITENDVFKGVLYRPISTFSYYLIGKIFSYSSFYYHLSNVLFHCINSILVFFLCLCLSLKKNAALIASIIFSIHPVHTEAVSNASNITEEICFFFEIMALLIIFSNIKLKYYLFSLAFIFSLLTKENAIILPFLVIGIYYYLSSIPKKENSFEINYFKVALTLIIPIVFYFATRYIIIGSFIKNPFLQFIPLDNPIIEANLKERIYTSSYIFWKYFSLTVYPAKLCADYSYNSISIIKDYSDSRFIIAAFFLLGFGSSIFSLIKRRRYIEILGLYIFSIGLLPFNNVIFIGGALIAERFLYLPSLGICIIFGTIFDNILKISNKKSFLLASILLFFIGTILIYSTILRNQIWRNDLTLFKDVLKKFPRNAKANYNVGAIYLQENKNEEAKGYFKNAISIYPSYYEAYLALAKIYIKERQYNLAIENCKKAIEVRPNFAEPYNLLAAIYLETGKVEEIDNLNIKNESKEILNFYIKYNLGLYYFNLKEWEKSENYFLQAIDLFDYDETHYYLGIIYINANILDKAFKEFIKCQNLYNKHPDILKYLSLLYIRRLDFENSKEIAMKYVKEFPEDAEGYAIVARNYLSGYKDYENAKKYMKIAISKKKEICNFKEVKDICQQLGLL